MSNLMKKVEQKLGDHPQVNEDPNVNPTSGVGKGANQGDDPNKTWMENKIEAGQGSGSKDDVAYRAGQTTSADTVSAGTTSGAIANGGRH